jgi:hypothetical protein
LTYRTIDMAIVGMEAKAGDLSLASDCQVYIVFIMVYHSRIITLFLYKLEQGKNISVIAKATITATGSVMGEETRRRRNPAKRGQP